ncbi:outer-membrane lipoprotein carrier protein LolA [Candidatus Pelagibacter sp.]|nr:outer-membrane lipoprotein carrier protein LolA [Candidatus Pelagibacter sp.]
MFRIAVIFILLNFYNSALASIKEDIILKMQVTNNLSFNFIQTINDKSESGKCILEYPKKIYCEYNKTNKKIIVSNGSSLVIKTNNSNNYNIYQLDKTPLEYLLDKEYIIFKIRMLEPRDIDDKYINFEIIENNNKINIFFNKKNLNLIGWQTEDVYQNLSVTFISSVKINQKIDEKKFILPENN